MDAAFAGVVVVVAMAYDRDDDDEAVAGVLGAYEDDDAGAETLVVGTYDGYHEVDEIVAEMVDCAAV